MGDQKELISDAKTYVNSTSNDEHTKNDNIQCIINALREIIDSNAGGEPERAIEKLRSLDSIEDLDDDDMRMQFAYKVRCRIDLALIYIESNEKERAIED